MRRVKGFTDAPFELDDHHSRPEVDYMFYFRGSTYRMVSSLDEEALKAQFQIYHRFGHKTMSSQRFNKLCEIERVRWRDKEDRIYHYYQTMSCDYNQATRVSFHVSYNQLKDTLTEHPSVEWADNWVDNRFVVCVHVRGLRDLHDEITKHLVGIGLKEYEQDLSCLELLKLSRRSTCSS